MRRTTVLAVGGVLLLAAGACADGPPAGDVAEGDHDGEGTADTAHSREDARPPDVGADGEDDGTRDVGFACGNGIVEPGEECDGPLPRSCVAACGSTGTTTCIACRWSTCTPPREMCNGIDDDCDGAADNGFPCTRGRPVSCVTACGTAGTAHCTEICSLPTATDCRPPTEACGNGLDDDCDTEVDELMPGQCVPGTVMTCTTPCGSTGTGTCSSTCVPPGPDACTPPPEACDGLDNDCDGAADEDFPCHLGSSGSCTTSCGTPGARSCSTTCMWRACTAAEICNGLDDDCDGRTDDLCCDADGDGFGAFCPAGIDCYEGNPSHHDIPRTHMRIAQMITRFNLFDDSAPPYSYEYLACHDLIAVDYSNLAGSGTPGAVLDLSLLRAMNPDIIILVYVHVAALWDSADVAHDNPTYGLWWDSLPRELWMRTVAGDLVSIWEGMSLMNITANLVVAGQTYLQRAGDYLVGSVVPASGGLASVDGLFIDNAFGSGSGISWIAGFYGTDSLDSNGDTVADTAAFLDDGYASSIRGLYATLRSRLPGVVLVGNHPWPSDLDYLDGRYGETDGGASSLDSSIWAMRNSLDRFTGQLASVRHSILNLRSGSGPREFSGLDAAAYAFLLNGYAYVSFDDAPFHNVPVPMPVEYAAHSWLGPPSGGPTAHASGVYYRRFAAGTVIVNGSPIAATVTFLSGAARHLGAGEGTIVSDTSPFSISVDSCTFALAVDDGTAVDRLETNANCGVDDCGGDGWWSSVTDGGGSVPPDVETARGAGPLMLNIHTAAGWASETGQRPTLAGTPLTNVQPNPGPTGGTLFMFCVTESCAVVNASTCP